MKCQASSVGSRIGRARARPYIYMYLYVIDLLEPLELSPSGCHHFCEGAQGFAQWVFSVTAEYSGSTQCLLRAH